MANRLLLKGLLILCVFHLGEVPANTEKKKKTSPPNGAPPVERAPASSEALPAAEPAPPTAEIIAPDAGTTLNLNEIAETPTQNAQAPKEAPLTVNAPDPNELIKKATAKEESVSATSNLPPPVDVPTVPEVAVILEKNQFRPAQIRLREGLQTKLIFTTINKKSAALIIERLNVQRWIAKEPQQTEVMIQLDGQQDLEVKRELRSDRVTEVVLQPAKGTYTFHDALTGATGELYVE